MSGGAYSALSGMQSRLEELDRIASDLANVSTAGYKTERTATFAAERDFAAALKAAGKPVQFNIGQHYNHFEMGETFGSPYGVNGRAVLEQMRLRAA